VGIAGLAVVAVAVLLSTTLLPALLAILGRSIDRPRWIARRLEWYHRPSIWERWARSLSRHPYRAVALGGAAIGILTVPALFMRIGLPSRNWWPTETEAGAGIATLARMGMSGYVQPLRVIIEFPDGTDATSATALRGLKRLSDSLRADPRIRDVKSLVDLSPGKSVLEYSLLYSEPDTVRARYPEFLDAYLARDGRTTLMDIIPADTTSLTTTMDVVRDVRRLARDHHIRQLDGATIRVGGYVAAALDFQHLLLKRFPLIVGLIMGVTALMLAVVFKSVLVPIKAVVMNSLSVSATFGIIVLVFQHGIGGQLFGINGPTSAIYVLVPVIVFAVVFGLSMDYEVFLLMRIKEEFDRTGQNTIATREGLSATASVITSAALIMIAVFGAFAFAHILLMQFIGFGLAVAVFLDATVVRMILVPSFMQIAGKWNWWPGVRDRR
jgi:RND superfamily putative drug exporter